MTDEQGLPRWYIPRRYLLFAFISLGLILGYGIRVILSIAIVPIAKEQDWDAGQQGKLLGFFDLNH